MEFLTQQNIMLGMENKTLKQRLESLTEEQLIKRYYGGKAQYVRWGKEAGLDLTSDDDFFSDPTIKSYYKAFVEAVLTRIGFYGLSTPELLLVNPDAYSGHAGTDFIRNHQALGIDLASVYIYSDTWLPHSIEENHLQFVNTWMQQHIDDVANLLGMPIVMGEFGVSLKDGKFDNEFRETFMETVYSNFLSSWKRGVIGGGCLLWQLFPEGAEHMDDGYAVIFAKSPSILNLLANHSMRLLANHSMWLGY